METEQIYAYDKVCEFVNWCCEKKLSIPQDQLQDLGPPRRAKLLWYQNLYRTSREACLADRTVNNAYTAFMRDLKNKDKEDMQQQQQNFLKAWVEVDFEGEYKVHTSKI